MIRQDNLWVGNVVVREDIPASLIERLKAVERIVRARSHVYFDFSCQHCHFGLFLSSLNILFIVELEEIVALFDLSPIILLYSNSGKTIFSRLTAVFEEKVDEYSSTGE